MNIYTIGFTKKSASTFFGLLRTSGATQLVDVRLNNVSQLAGFAKRDDLRYFLHELCDMRYTHQLSLAPTQAMLDDYKKHDSGWSEYERRFSELMAERRIHEILPQESVENSVLLCSEPTAHRCHRRLVAEHFAHHWGNVEIRHL